MGALALVDLALSDHRLGVVLAGATAVLAFARSVTWGTLHTFKIPMLWILHAGHAFVVLGLGLRVASALTTSIPASSALHALTAGAIGCTTLGMMARVSLGHTGRPLVASLPVALSFGAAILAALVRVFGSMSPAAYKGSLHGAGTLWALAWLTFAIAHARILVRPRVDGKPG
jgi:uncharacterized protein involved in response to NO